MMDANFSLKRLTRKKELVAYPVTEETHVWVDQNEVDAVAEENRKIKDAMKKKGKAPEARKVLIF
jgi:ubiquinone biosynthesis protein UbiJ